MGAGDKRGALRIALQALRRGRRGDEWASDDVAPAGRARAAAGPSWSRPTRRRCRAPRRPRRRCWRCSATLARAYEGELANPEAAIARNQKILELAPKDPEAVGGARAALHRDRALRRPARHLRQEAASWPRARPRSWRSASSSPSLYEEEIKQPDKAIELYRAILAQDPQQLPALVGARSHLSAARPLEGAGGDDRPGDRAVDRHGRGRRAEVPARRGPGAVPRRRRGRGRLVPRGAGARPDARRRAHGAAGVSVEQRRRAAARGRRGARADLRADRRPRPPGRGPANQARAREEDRQARRPAAAHRRARRPARERRPGVGRLHARGRREPGVARRRARRSRTWPTSSTTGSRWSRCTRRRCRRRARRSCRRRSSASSCWSSRSPTTRSWSSRRRRSSTSGARRASSPRTRRRWSRWSGSTRAPSAGAIWSTRC